METQRSIESIERKMMAPSNLQLVSHCQTTLSVVNYELIYFYESYNYIVKRTIKLHLLCACVSLPEV